MHILGIICIKSGYIDNIVGYITSFNMALIIGITPFYLG